MTDQPATKKPAIDDLLDVMARLRNPDNGCPWDREQTFETIAPYTIEEAYEVADAIESGDMDQLEDELGDLLFQVVFYAQMSRESGGFDFDSVARRISTKMRDRHQHVFGAVDERTSEGQTIAWESQKAQERKARAAKTGRKPSALDGVALALPALMRAQKLQKRAASEGFDWTELPPVIDKIREELAELQAEIDAKANIERLQDEAGDLLFAAVNLARHLGVDAEVALRGTNAKFERRFRLVEEGLEKEGKSLNQADLDEMEAHWVAAKAAE
jgi:nucleoside triphosphate diphosphatase